MKKLIVITFAILFATTLFVVIVGIENKYYYENKKATKTEHNNVLNNTDFRIRIDAFPNSENENLIDIILYVDKIISPIKFESAKLNALDSANFELKTKKVTATDGFYNWDQEKNGSANSFENLPEYLRYVDKELKAYFAYTWTFEGSSKNLNQIEIRVSLSIKNIEGQNLKINKTFQFVKKEKIIFRNPIRFH